MIVRDEEEHLGACLASLAGIVDDVVVVDTGSVDDTVAIATRLGARVYHHPWADDFSDARNVALDHADGRWILYIDADERLRPIARERVVALLEPAEEVAFRVWLRPFLGATPAREYRLWRNDPRIRFVGVIHEKVVPAIQAVAVADGRAIGLCDLELDHLGYEHDQYRKHERNLPLLRAQLREEPRNVFNWHHLATVLMAMGETAEATAALEEARMVIQRDAESAAELPSSGVLVYTDLFRMHREQGDSRFVRDLGDEAARAYPDSPLIVWEEVRFELDVGEWELALAALDRLAAIDPEALDDTVSYDERLFGLFAAQARALACFRLGQFHDAAEAYAVAEREEPSNPEHRVKRIMCERLAGEAS